jgi:dolichyl-phosphate-mannose-protein mannosyltransferase
MTIRPTPVSDAVTEAPLAWEPADTLLIGILAIAALATRFWRLGYPGEAVFDELQFVGQAQAFLRGEQFVCVHPALPSLVIAAAIKLFGEQSWVWRFPSAALGVTLVLITFLLGREMFRSRLVATLSAGFVLCDGMFLIHSRLGMLESFHLTLTAASYLLLFQFLHTRDPFIRRRKTLYIGLVSGAAIASKLLIPVIGFLLVSAFLLKDMASRKLREGPSRQRGLIGAAVLLISSSSMVYLATFVPNYWLGWWHGAGALVSYYNEVLYLLGQMSETTSRFVSPWWSWPFMLRAPLYWQSRSEAGLIATIWEGGNPILWWSSLVALIITIVRGVERRTTSRTFLVIGYFSYMGALALAKHPFFLYIYMTPVYLQYLMLAVVLADCWNGKSRRWEEVGLALSLTPACVLGFGTIAGIACILTLLIAYSLLVWRFTVASKFVCGVTLAALIAVFVFFLPVWLGTPLTPDSYNARIWLHGPGVAKWM